ncbi:RNA polymerase II C-terminal domain phosphatase-like 1 [Platanthera guangdongensis]|uniref:RNA polymerase II C-terminal domain phosphatase-like 1 n=1 Tax=Platanthera guangdongensis TaxID=2320717 RepID=A0ABR2LNF7_9ASPA
MSEIFFEDEVEYPSAPDCGNYLIPKDDTSTLIGNKNPLGFDGMADAEVERRLKGVNRIGQSIPPIADNFDTRAAVPSGPTVMTPTPGRDDNLFKPSKLPKVEQEIVSFLADERQDTHYYLPLSLAVENVTPENTTLKFPLNKPQRLEEEVLTQRGSLKRPYRQSSNVVECQGKARFSVDLPSFLEKRQGYSPRRCGTTALYERKNLKEMRDIPVQKVQAMVAQAQARITVMSHFMGCQLRRSLNETKSLYEERSTVYDLKNPKFIKEVFKYCKDTCEDTLNWLGARDGLTYRFESVGFTNIYPIFAEVDIEATITALGESDVDEDEEEVEGEGGEEEEKKEEEGEKGEENKEEKLAEIRSNLIYRDFFNVSTSPSEGKPSDLAGVDEVESKLIDLFAGRLQAYSHNNG